MQELLNKFYHRHWSYHWIRLLPVDRVTIFCTGNLTLEQVVFKLSYLSNYDVYFVETCRVHIK